MIDLQPATDALSSLINGVEDSQLGAPTPCAGTSVAALLDHVDSLARGFALAARKQMSASAGPPPTPDPANLGDDWRTRLPDLLGSLAEAWREPGAWEGMTHIGGLDMPGEAAALVAVDEVIVHGWDLAMATSQPYAVDDALVEAALGFVAGFVASSPAGVPGLFGPVVPVPDDAAALTRLVGLTGRDPGWRPPRT